MKRRHLVAGRAVTTRLMPGTILMTCRADRPRPGERGHGHIAV